MSKFTVLRGGEGDAPDNATSAYIAKLILQHIVDWQTFEQFVQDDMGVEEPLIDALKAVKKGANWKTLTQPHREALITSLNILAEMRKDFTLGRPKLAESQPEESPPVKEDSWAQGLREEERVQDAANRQQDMKAAENISAIETLFRRLAGKLGFTLKPPTPGQDRERT